MPVSYTHLRPEQEITVCTEFTLDGTVKSVRRFLDAEDYEPVSYTHLDVYKRQPVKALICRKICFLRQKKRQKKLDFTM